MNKGCDNCEKYKVLLEEEKMKKMVPIQSEEVNSLKSKISQLETLIRISKEEKHDTISMDQHIQFLQNQLTEKQLQIANLQNDYSQINSELLNAKTLLDETNHKIVNFPLVEQRYSLIIETMKGEYKALAQEAREKTKLYEASAQKYQEARRQVLQLQTELSKIRDQSENLREELTFHRTKKEEAENLMTTRQSQMEKDSQTIISHLERQLKDKDRECNSCKKLLSDTRRQLAITLSQSQKSNV